MRDPTDRPPADAVPLREALNELADELVSEPYWVGDRPYGSDPIDKYRPPPKGPSIIQREYAIRHGVLAGQLRAWARDGSPTGDWLEITQYWVRLGGDVDFELGIASDECSDADAPGGFRSATMRFFDIHVSRAEPEEIVQHPASTIAGETRCTESLASLMANSSRPEYPKAVYRRQACAQFKVSGRAFDRAWDRAMEKTKNFAWSKAGPRLKSKR